MLELLDEPGFATGLVKEAQIEGDELSPVDCVGGEGGGVSIN